jgi:hypothetical protein
MGGRKEETQRLGTPPLKIKLISDRLKTKSTITNRRPETRNQIPGIQSPQLPIPFPIPPRPNQPPRNPTLRPIHRLHQRKRLPPIPIRLHPRHPPQTRKIKMGRRIPKPNLPTPLHKPLLPLPLLPTLHLHTHNPLLPPLFPTVPTRRPKIRLPTTRPQTPCRRNLPNNLLRRPTTPLPSV